MRTHRKIFQFKVFDEQLQKFLSIQPNLTEFLTNLVNDFRQGKLVPLENREIDKKIKIARLEKLNKELIILDFKIKRTAIESNYSPSESLEVLKGKIPIIDTNQIQLLLQPDGRCPQCGHIHMIYNKTCSRWDCECKVREFKNE